MKACAHSSPSSLVRLCENCELPVDRVKLLPGQTANCPRCGTTLYRSDNASLNGNLALAITCLLLFIPSHYFDFITIRLVGVMIEGTLIEAYKPNKRGVSRTRIANTVLPHHSAARNVYRHSHRSPLGEAQMVLSSQRIALDTGT